MKELLIKLKIIHVVSNEERRKAGIKILGKGYFKAYRFNPFNPLSYVLIIIIPVIFLMHGFVGVFKKVINPFQWN